MKSYLYFVKMNPAQSLHWLTARLICISGLLIGFVGWGCEQRAPQQIPTYLADTVLTPQANNSNAMQRSVEMDSAVKAHKQAIFLEFKKHYLVSFHSRNAGPLPFDSVLTFAPRLDTHWVSLGWCEQTHIRTSHFGDTLELLFRHNNDIGRPGWSLTNIKMNGRTINTWPATEGCAVGRWTKIELYGNPWWCFELYFSPCNGSGCRVRKLLFVNEMGELFFSEYGENTFNIHFGELECTPTEGWSGCDIFQIVDYNHDSIPEYWVTNGPDGNSPVQPWKLILYTVNKNYPRRAAPLPHSPTQFYIMPYFTFGLQHIISHGDSVIAWR